MSRSGAGDAVGVAVLRDTPTWISYAQLALYGWFLYAFGPSLTLLQQDQGTSRTVASLHGTALAVGAIGAGFGAPALVRRIGRGPMLRLGSVVLSLGILIYIGTTALPLTIAGTLLVGIGSTLALVGINAFISDHQGPAAPRSLSEGNGIAALAGLLGPVTVGIGVGLSWGWRPALLVVALSFLVLEVVRGRDLVRYDGSHGQAESGAITAAPGAMPRRYWYAWAVIFTVVGTEFCMTLWGSDLLRDRAGLGDAAASAAIVTVVGGMTVGRLGGSLLVGRMDPERLLVITFGVTVIGFFLAWVSSSAVPMLVGFAVSGLGIGLQWPLGVSRALRAAESRSDRGSALASIAAGTAAGLAPFILGFVADHVGVHSAFLIVPVLMAVGTLLVRSRPVPLLVVADPVTG